MSYHHNQSAPDIGMPVIIGIIALMVVGSIAVLSRGIAIALGADFLVVFSAMIRTAGGLLVFGGLVIGLAYVGMFNKLGCVVALFLAVLASVVWWCFGAVLDSMALGGLDPSAYYGDRPWWIRDGYNGAVRPCC